MEIANKDDDLFLRLSEAPIPAAPDCGGPMTEGITGPASTGQSRGSGNPVPPLGTPETPVVWLVCFLGVGAGCGRGARVRDLCRRAASRKCTGAGYDGGGWGDPGERPDRVEVESPACQGVLGFPGG